MHGSKTLNWSEPPHLWIAVVGDSGVGMSPGADCLLHDVLPVVEDRMMRDFPERLQEWRAKVELQSRRRGTPEGRGVTPKRQMVRRRSRPPSRRTAGTAVAPKRRHDRKA
jgi:hypothetical protein